MLKTICNIFSKPKPLAEEAKSKQKETNYTDFDYECLVELYYKNDWLRHEINKEGLENLWTDYDDLDTKNILVKLLNKFKYVTQEDAAIDARKKLAECIRDISLNPNNTLFIGFQRHNYPDGSQVTLNFIKSILVEINPDWEEKNLLPSFSYGIGRIKKDGFPRNGIHLKNIVLVDDFIGTGGTAFKNISEIQALLREHKKDFTLSVFTIAAMNGGIKRISPLNVKLYACYELEKATRVIWPVIVREIIRVKLRRMESILYNGTEPETLKKFSLGYGKSEAIYSLTRFNLPNNNLPIFWWNRYKDGKSRKPLFNRNQ